jgi:hypothetical protein
MNGAERDRGCEDSDVRRQPATKEQLFAKSACDGHEEYRSVVQAMRDRA